MNKEVLKTYSYSKLLFELINLNHLHNFKTKLIGYEKFEKIKATYPIYRFIINPSAKIKFGIFTGMHGDEIAGPLSILHLLKEPNKYLNKRICYYIYPTISPTAFDLRRRYDDDNVELNTLNKKTLNNYKYRELKYVYQDVKNKKFDAIISLHEDVQQKRFYAYVNNDNNDVYKNIINNAEKYCGILKSKIIDKRLSNQKGFIVSGHDDTIEDSLFIDKKPKICITTETPGKINLDTRIKINLKNIILINNQILKN